MGCRKLEYYKQEALGETTKNLEVVYAKKGMRKKKCINYYPGGSLQPGRSFSSNSYRYGFNGHESDDEIFGSKNSYDFGARMYNPRLGRMFSVDPWASKYSWQSPYAYHRNTPVWRIDWMGYGDPPWWEAFIVGSVKQVGRLYTHINNNPAHAGYSVKPQKVTQEQVQAYSINWSKVLDPNYQIQSFAESTVNTVQGVYQFGEGIYEGDGAKSAEALPDVITAAATIYGLRGFNLTQKIAARTNLANSFYKKSGYSGKRLSDHTAGINFDKAVQTKTLKKGTVVNQWVGENGVGNYFTTGENSAKNLGISYEGRTLKQFTLTDDVKVLQSTAADLGGNAGGGTQFFSKELKNNITPVQ